MSVDIDSLKASQTKGLVVGVVPRSGPTPLRLEIDDFIQDEELANLYFLACEAFMQDKIHTQPFSYNEISGIHGQPYRAWDNVKSAKFNPTGGLPNSNTGYCAHGSVLFPTWHRAYLAQFEQALFIHASDIAAQFPGNSAKAALDRFRIPYWDPLLPRQKLIDTEEYKYGVPVIFTLPNIMVRRPETPETLKPMPNPLYRFPFPQDSLFQNSMNWPDNEAFTQGTIRGFDGTTQGSNHSWVMQSFDNSFNPDAARSTDPPGRLWRVMLSDMDYMTMSNHWDPRNRQPVNKNYNENSLEGFHDDIHGMVGGGPSSDSTGIAGHMSDPAFAGFDPVFWLHHCNVDRLLAIWQGIHSGDSDAVSWWVSELHVQATFVEPANEDETPETSLVPFRRSLNGPSEPTWWKSIDLRDWRKLGYEYPQTAAARQKGDTVKELTAWANAELGWAAGSGTPGQADEQARIHLKQQITELVQAFPSPILVDGTVPLDDGEQFISSSVTTAPFSPADRLLSTDAVKIHETTAQPQAVLAAVAKPVQALVNLVSPAKDVTHDALKKALPAHIKPDFSSFGDLVSQGKMTQWNASFKVEKFALDGSFTIYFFLGDFTENYDTWPHEPNMAGSSNIFASGRNAIEGGSCANCQKQDDQQMKYYDTVGLTPALLTYWKSGEAANGLRVTSLEPDVVGPFLTRNLHWRVIDVRGAHIPRESIPSLKVLIYSETVHLPQELTEVPRFENQVAHADITDGRPGGFNMNDVW